MKQITNTYTSGNCFFCGPRNPIGLRLTFYETETEPNEVVCRLVPSSLYAGYGKILHGGIQSGLFDEIMGWFSLVLTGQLGVTGSLQIEFLKPLYVEQEIEVRCQATSQEGARVNFSAEITDQARTVCTRATGTYILVEEDRFKRLVGEE
ncbi:MAG TPA: PaaI family thioesterase [Desulfomonilaceae bacterium]|nr:PaaI family thioesterase [Desulfomonilaceae bacterium]